MIKEDLLYIKGELRKLNLRHMNEDVRRQSIIIENLDKSSQQSPVRDQVDGCTRERPECLGLCPDNISLSSDFSNGCKDSSHIPSAPPLPSPPGESGELLIMLERSIQDESGPPSAPSYAQVAGVQLQVRSGDISRDDANKVSVAAIRHSSKQPNAQKRVIPSSSSSSVAVDTEGFQLVQRNRRRRENFIGSKKMNGNKVIKSAPKLVDIYVGNVDNDVTVEAMIDYVKQDIGISIEKCESLKSRNPNNKSFKLSLSVNERSKLLAPEVWPEGIICRKFYSPRTSQ